MKVNLVNYSNLFGPPKNDHPLIAGLIDLMDGYWFDNNKNNIEGIMMYLVDNPNSSLLNMLTITMEIVDTKDITRIFLADNNLYTFELSLPYDDQNLSFTTKDIKIKDKDSTQLSRHYNMKEWGETLLNNEWKELQYRTINQAKEYYATAIGNDISQIEAESLLPMGLSESKIYVQATIKNWVQFINDNLDSMLTYEQTNVIKACSDKIYEIAPFVAPLLGR